MASSEPTEVYSDEGLAILSRAYESKADFKVFAQTLDGQAAYALMQFIQAVLDYEDLDWDLLPEPESEYWPLDLAFDAGLLLSHMNLSVSIPLLVNMFEQVTDDEHLSKAAEAKEIVANFAPSAAARWFEFAIRPESSAAAKSFILAGIDALAVEHPSIREEFAPQVSQLLSDADKITPLVYGQLVAMAMHWKLTASAEDIERAFSRNQVDCGVVESWEMVRLALGVQGLGLPMPEHPLNGAAQWRRDMGVGAFSDAPLFSDGELKDSARYGYVTKAKNLFRDSGWARDSADPACGYKVFHFLGLGLSYLGVTAENMTEGNAAEILLELFPRKVNLAAEKIDSTIDELVAFWNYCAAVHGFEHATSMANRISSWREEFRRAMSNPANFGPAKRMVMAGKAAGFDMTTQAGAAAFMAQYNAARIAALTRRTDPPSRSAEPTLSVSIPRDLKDRKKLLKKLKRK